MSHFTRIRTSLVVEEYLIRALADLGYACETGGLEIRGFGGRRTRVDVKVSTRNHGYDIGFRRVGDAYELVADWWGVRGIDQKRFLAQVTRRYAYQAARSKLEEQGFDLVSEEAHKDGSVHLVLRRTV